MPIPAAHIARASGQQNNCAIHALLHFITRDNSVWNNLSQKHRDELLRADQAVRGGRQISWDEFLEEFYELQSHPSAPKREAVFGPVFRHTLGPNLRKDNPLLEAEDLCSIANRFNIKVEAYTSEDYVKKHYDAKHLSEIMNTPSDPRHPDYNRLQVYRQTQSDGSPFKNDAPVLKLVYTADGHFDFADPVHAKEHNEAFNNREDYSANLHLLNSKILESRALRRGRRGFPTLNRAFIATDMGQQSTTKDELNTWFAMLKDIIIELTNALRSPENKTIFQDFLAALKGFFDVLEKAFNPDASSATAERKYKDEKEKSESENAEQARRLAEVQAASSVAAASAAAQPGAPAGNGNPLLFAGGRVAPASASSSAAAAPPAVPAPAPAGAVPANPPGFR